MLFGGIRNEFKQKIPFVVIHISAFKLIDTKLCCKCCSILWFENHLITFSPKGSNKRVQL